MSFSVIVNPAARQGDAGAQWLKAEPVCHDVLGAFVFQMTRKAGDATELCRMALMDGHQHIVSFGGDGTHNEVVNGFFDKSGKPVAPEATLSLVSAGSGCDLSRTLGLPRDVSGALVRIRNGHYSRTIDLGRIVFCDRRTGQKKTRFFINAASMGISGAVLRMLRRHPNVLRGRLGYSLATLAVTLRFKDRNIRIKVGRNMSKHENTKLVVAANGKFFGGGMKVAPMADPFDGQLEFLGLRGMHWLPFLRLAARVFSGKHIGHDCVWHHRGRKLLVEGPKGFLVEIDGECVGTLPAEVEIVPRALMLRL